MIYTVTCNPAIDYVMELEQFRLGETNRSVSEAIFFGGKGINVSRVLKALSLDSVALGFCAGFTGEAIAESLAPLGIDSAFVILSAGTSRINVKLKGIAETEINGQGPEVTEADLLRFYEIVTRLKSGDTLILSGSIPRGLSPNIYGEILRHCSGKDIRCIVDSSGSLLEHTLCHHPFLIKPNLAELSALFGKPISDQAEIIACAKELQQRGAVNVLVSMAKDGAVLLDEFGKLHFQSAPHGTTVNSVGAGDSMVAGFLAGYLQTKDYAYALTLGTAAGAATAFSQDLATGDRISAVLKQLG